VGCGFGVHLCLDCKRRTTKYAMDDDHAVIVRLFNVHSSRLCSTSYHRKPASVVLHGLSRDNLHWLTISQHVHYKLAETTFMPQIISYPQTICVHFIPRKAVFLRLNVRQRGLGLRHKLNAGPIRAAQRLLGATGGFVNVTCYLFTI